MNRRLNSLRRLGDIIATPPKSDSGLRRFAATVVSVQTGPPKTLTVNVAGSAVNVPGIRYADSIATPTAGDVVWLHGDGPDLIAVYRLA